MYSYFEDKAFMCQIKDSWFESNPVRKYFYKVIDETDLCN